MRLQISSQWHGVAAVSALVVLSSASSMIVNDRQEKEQSSPRQTLVFVTTVFELSAPHKHFADRTKVDFITEELSVGKRTPTLAAYPC